MGRRLLATAVAALVVAACAGPENGRSAATERPEPYLEAPAAPRASAGIVDASGRPVGSVDFAEERQQVRVYVSVVGLPEGEHGVHVHVAGRCEGPSFATAGAHFDPAKRVHGHLTANGPHAGDLGSLKVGSDGRAKQAFYTPHLSLNPAAPNSVLLGGGLSVVIHARADDQRTDPDGNSGERIACGVIKALPLP